MLLVGDRGAGLRVRAEQRALQRGGGISCSAQRHNRQTKYGADDTAQSTGGLAPAGLLDAFQEIENFGSRDLCDRAIGERRGQVFQ